MKRIVQSIAMSGLFWGMCLNGACAREKGDWAMERQRMIEVDLKGRGIRDPIVLRAMERVRREAFVPEESRRSAYNDHPLPIGQGQTISQPYIVALMTELAAVDEESAVFEVGTGSGYQAAVLAEIVRQVYTVEIVPELAESAAARLAELGYSNVTVRAGDGYVGWPEHAPFDAILVTAAPERVPPPLIEQLKVGGRLVIPVGPVHAVQHLKVIVRNADGTTAERNTIPVRFVPMTGPGVRGEGAN